MQPSRRTIRLRGYDYAQNGWYFVTICTENRECLFGQIVDGKMVLNNVGKIIENIWETLPKHHPVILDTFQIMPNHVHFIIQIINMGAARPIDAGAARHAPTHPTLGTVVGMFKSACSKQINIVGATRGSPVHTVRGSPVHIWQRNFYEHIIRNEGELFTIRKYIEENPSMWERDRNNLNLKS